MDQCVFLKFCSKTGDLIGICGVYVDDFLLAGNWSEHRYAAECAKVKALYTFGAWNSHKFTLCGVDYVQDKHYNVRMTQKKYTDSLRTFELPYWCKDGDGLSSHGVKQLRSGNGALQWLVTNTRPDLAASCSLSQGNVQSAKIADHNEMNKLIR